MPRTTTQTILVDFQESEALRSPVIVAVDDLIGKPYEGGGRGPDSYDCYGLVVEVESRMGRRVPDVGVPSTRASMIIPKLVWSLERL